MAGYGEGLYGQEMYGNPTGSYTAICREIRHAEYYLPAPTDSHASIYAASLNPSKTTFPYKSSFKTAPMVVSVEVSTFQDSRGVVIPAPFTIFAPPYTGTVNQPPNTAERIYTVTVVETNIYEYKVITEPDYLSILMSTITPYAKIPSGVECFNRRQIELRVLQILRPDGTRVDVG